ncbi:uncharacterized protein LOC142230343 [Haematobia irritans]|uniref:uncharacterized protein LOC142230343 n=1 Tax=Haematobia irritans TaxID=7368 RepID=UPI003F502298
MKFLKISLILLSILLVYTEAGHIKRRREAVINDADGDGIPNEMDDDYDKGSPATIDDDADDFVDNGDDEIKDLKTVSIKSRVITLDRELCREQSRYHPHFPKCQLYCENLKHWMGMCRRDTCHCYS